MLATATPTWKSLNVKMIDVLKVSFTDVDIENRKYHL